MWSRAWSARHWCAASAKECARVQTLPRRVSKENHDRRVAEDKTPEAAEDKNGARGLGLGRVARSIAVRRRLARHGRCIRRLSRRRHLGGGQLKSGHIRAEHCERALCDIVRRL